MKIRVWGCRGSLPTPGPETVRYGGNTTCLEVRLSDNTLLVVDAGSGIRKLGRKLLKEEGLSEIYLFLTHAHWDHLMGFPFFRPAYSSKYKLRVRGGARAKRSLARYLKQQMQAPFFPIPFDEMKAKFDFTLVAPERIRVGPAEIIPIRLNHPNGGYGLKVIEEDRAFVFLTDNELDYEHKGGMTTDEYTDLCRGAALLIHDAQYTGEEYKATKGWGHTTFSSATELGIQARVKRLGLFHHDPEHTDDDVDRFVISCQEQIRQAHSNIECFGVKEGMEIIV
jgi:phosphoribosyl 1,2-cyclic phosphodiesterase